MAYSGIQTEADPIGSGAMIGMVASILRKRTCPDRNGVIYLGEVGTYLDSVERGYGFFHLHEKAGGTDDLANFRGMEVFGKRARDPEFLEKIRKQRRTINNVMASSFGLEMAPVEDTNEAAGFFEILQKYLLLGKNTEDDEPGDWPDY